MSQNQNHTHQFAAAFHLRYFEHSSKADKEIPLIALRQIAQTQGHPKELGAINMLCESNNTIFRKV